MTDLIARLEKAEGPDRKLDVEIYVALNPGCFEQDFNGYWRATAPNPKWVDWHEYNAPTFTASLDAALTLVPEGYGYHVEASNNHEVGHASISDNWLDEPHKYYAEKMANPAIALCIACLKARQQEGAGS